MAFLWTVVFAVTIAACVIFWGLALLKLAAGLPLVAWTPRRRVPWAFFDLLAVVAIYFLAGGAVLAAGRSLGWPLDKPEETLSLAQREVKMLSVVAISLGILVVGLPLIALRTRARLSDFGWSRATLAADVRLGLIAFAMLAPPVYALQALLVRYWPSHHPLVKMFKETPDGTFFLVLLLAAVVSAPLFEEILFRVLLQGFLEKVVSFRGRLEELFLGGGKDSDHAEDPPPAASAPAANWAAQEDHAGAVAAKASPATAGPPPEPGAIAAAESRPIDPGGADPLVGVAAWLPIVVSSLIFALLHWEHGPDWVALTPLAVGMGYLYQRTHRLVPSLVVHVALNALSMWGLWIEVQQPKPPHLAAGSRHRIAAPRSVLTAEPASVPILPASTSDSGSASPTKNNDIVNPIPARQAPPASEAGVTPAGNWAQPNRTAPQQASKMPSGLPAVRPAAIARATGSKSASGRIVTPALASAKSGMIP
jgi:membrane protease YdiL (CAAX protease family)